jgi:hypothetical protein
MGNMALEFFEGTGNFTKNFRDTRNELVVVNDGTGNLTFTAGNTVFMLKPGEVFDEVIVPFNSIKIESSGDFRGFVREDK